MPSGCITLFVINKAGGLVFNRVSGKFSPPDAAQPQTWRCSLAGIPHFNTTLS
jgi:hypothetical protein